MKQYQHGVTLVELVITLSIMSILSTICIPYFNDMFAKQEAQRIPFLITIQIQKARNAASLIAITWCCALAPICKIVIRTGTVI